MFRFSAKDAIMSMTDIYPMDEVNRALDSLSQNRVRYRPCY